MFDLKDPAVFMYRATLHIHIYLTWDACEGN